jgi:hypothetical protein
LHGGREGLYFRQSLSTRAAPTTRPRGDAEDLAGERAEQQTREELARARLKEQRLELQLQRLERERAARDAGEAVRPTTTDVVPSAIGAEAASSERQMGKRLLTAIFGGLMRRR